MWLRFWRRVSTLYMLDKTWFTEQVKWVNIVVVTRRPVKRSAHDTVAAFEDEPGNHASGLSFATRHQQMTTVDEAQAMVICRRATHRTVDSLEAARHVGKKTGGDNRAYSAFA